MSLSPEFAALAARMPPTMRHVLVDGGDPSDVAVEQQMVGRVHRIGQKRQSHVHRIVVEGTFEPRVVTERFAGV